MILDNFVAQSVGLSSGWVYPYQILESSIIVNGYQRHFRRPSLKTLQSSLRRLTLDGTLRCKIIAGKKSYCLS